MAPAAGPHRRAVNPSRPLDGWGFGPFRGQHPLLAGGVAALYWTGWDSTVADDGLPFLSKAWESLAGAESEFANDRMNNCANRCYYACFQAAIHALLRAGAQPRGGRTQWPHAFVQAEFVRALVRGRKLYSSDLRDTLVRTYILRQIADYEQDHVTELQAARGLRRTRTFLEEVRREGGAA